MEEDGGKIERVGKIVKIVKQVEKTEANYRVDD